MLVLLFVLGIGVAIWLHFRDAPAPPPVDSRPQTTSQPASGARGSPSVDTARATLARLPVKGWDRNSDFARYRFGEPWSDDVNVEFGHNGCNTRDDILRRDLADLVVRPGTCYAQSGVLHDPYTGQTIPFTRGPTTLRPCRSTIWCRCRTLGTRARASGTISAAATSPTTRATCWPSVRQANFDKAFRDATAWLPPNAAFRCEFVARQIDVKAAYGLWLSRNEKRAMEDVLARC